MSATTMHFGPEWMRTKHQLPSRSQPPPSPPPSAPASGASTYSALVSSAPPAQSEKHDEVHPFRYSKEEMLRIYKEGGGRGGLGLEVERWEGVVREAGGEPIGLREMGDSEKKLFAGSLNSDLRRRQSTDYLSPLSTQPLGVDRSRLNLNGPASGGGSPLRERFSSLRRRDSNADQPGITIPRKQSLSNLQAPLMSPRDGSLPSPRTRVGYTPSFDGVLNNGESWVARRRASEASLKSNIVTPRETSGDYQHGEKAPEIREEEEEIDYGALRVGRVEDKPVATQPNKPRGAPLSQSSGNETMIQDDVSTDMANLLLDNSSSNITDALGGPTGTGLPPGLLDLASIEWSYKDPSGQVQGPFRADLMQKWYDDGYFTPDLPMKRTHLDSQWMSVEELALRSGGDKIFLSLPIPSLPPGLSHRTESPLPNFGLLSDQHAFNGPYQPAPLRSLRSSTLDSYLGPGSNPSDSPSSSFGGGTLVEGSPDPNGFGGRAGYIVGDVSVGARVPGFSAISDPSGTYSSRMNTFNDSSPLDPSLTPRSSGFGNVVPSRPTVDNYTFNHVYSPSQGAWNTSSNNPGPAFDSSNIGRGSADHISYASNLGPVQTLGSGPATGFGSLRNVQENNFGEGAAYHSPDYSHYNSHNGTPAQGQQYPHSPSAQYANPHLQQSVTPSNNFIQPGNIPQIVPVNPQPVNQIQNSGSAPPQSPWSNETSTSRRPGPFETAHPTSANTMTIQPPAVPESSPWGRTSQPSRPSSRVNESSPWAVASQGIIKEHWTDEPAPDSLTFSNVGQHNQQQQQLAAPASHKLNAAEVSDRPLPLPEASEPAPAFDFVPKVTTIPPVKPKGKTTIQAAQPSAPKSASQIVPIPSPPPATPKAAWTKEDEAKKSKPSGVSTSLREIQEAESKKADARKLAEREKERAARGSVPVIESKEDAQAFTASWGLPTSQAGTRNSGPVKDSTPSSTPPTPAVWTTAVKASTSKKTMKEIQEEEERRKKTATRETIASATARRIHTEPTNKSMPPVQGSAWTTVGPSGKTSVVAAPPVRPTITPSTSTLSVPGSLSRVNGNTTPRLNAVSPTAKSAPLSPRADDHPVSPSHDFLKWLNESLKGLNNSVNVEEIMSMLLSFPMDPDPSTIELISELIYANSTTLDGRRFAAEFISRRKTDAASRPKSTGAPGKTAAKTISIADVVKATPKPTQPEWGFKVVNKKKRGGRT